MAQETVIKAINKYRLFLINEYIYPMIAAELISETEIFIENNKIDVANWLSSILLLKSFKKVSVTLKQSNWRTIAVKPQIIISNIELLTERELASGIPIPNNAPENEIEAERFPSLINFNSFIGVKKI